MPQENATVLMEGVRIMFRNFRGEETPYNKPGDRNFAVALPPEMAETLTADGWNVKKLDPREGYEEDGATFYLPVAIRFDVFPPRVELVTSNGRTRLDEEQIGMLDWADITNLDLIVRPHNWEMPGGKHGTKAYVKTMFVTIEEDELERKYGAMTGGPEE
jgi:hypothetical protein